MNNSSGHNMMSEEDLKKFSETAVSSLDSLYDENGEGIITDLKKYFSFIDSDNRITEGGNRYAVYSSNRRLYTS